MKHRIGSIALLLAMLLCLSLFPAGALASGEPQEEASAETVIPEEAPVPEEEPVPGEESPSPEDEPALDGAALISVVISGSAPRAGDKAAPFDPSIPYKSKTTGCYVKSAGTVHWYYARALINNPDYQFTKGKKYHFTMTIGADSSYQFARNAVVSFDDDRLSSRSGKMQSLP